MSALPAAYLELLSEKYPNEASVMSEIINLEAILALPKGTEHFISDLHGEFEAVRHILNSCSGVILEKVKALFEPTLGQKACHELCSLIYYPAEVLAEKKRCGELSDEYLRTTIVQLYSLADMLSSKYTRASVRKRIPLNMDFILNELMHTKSSDESEDKKFFHEALIDSIMNENYAVEVIEAFTELIKKLAVYRLHVLGDIYDRGHDAAGIVDLLMEQKNIDIQWGNHDILWIAAAAGSPASIASLMRITIRYKITDTLEKSYGISMRKLLDFCTEVYGDANHDTLKQAITVLDFKLEGHIIKRNPEFLMGKRLMLSHVDYENYTVTLDGVTHPLLTQRFPTVDPADPYRLSDEEQELIDHYVREFRESRNLRRHILFILRKGSAYLCYNGNLLYHGCIPLTEDGEFANFEFGGRTYRGKALMDFCDKRVREAYDRQEERDLDFIWYLWCGRMSPFSGRTYHTFERAYIEDRSTWVEPKDAYYGLWENPEVVGMILEEFGLSATEGHIINGHTPVEVIKGQSPIKADGRLFIIDGGFCKAYQKKTGIAGYTLIQNSHGLRLKSHRPFMGVKKVIFENVDMQSDSVPIETFPQRHCVSDTTDGKKIEQKLLALRALLAAYRSGELSPSH